MFTRWKAALAASLAANVILLALLVRAYTVSAGEETVAMATTVATTTSPTAVTATATEQATIPPTSTQAALVPTPTATATPIATSTPSPAPTATATAPPPSPTPTAILREASVPAWLAYANLFRAESGLPMLQEEPAWSVGSEAHSRYTVKTDQVSHSENAGDPWYTQGGHEAAQNGNLAATVWFDAPPEWAIDYWISAPFHGLPMLDPQLTLTGFGWYRENDGGTVFAATMDILRGLDQSLEHDSFPIFFPGDGGTAWVHKSFLPEWPDPLSSCPGYSKPTGPPLYVQFGSGSGTPQVTASSVRQGDRVLDHCFFGETTYNNPDPSAQRSGRRILDVRDAVVLIPRIPLEAGKSYTASVVADGTQYTWSFTAVAGPPESAR